MNEPPPPPPASSLPLHTEPSTTIPPSNSEPIPEKESISKQFVQIIEKITESLPVTILMSLFTIWALFSDDIRLSSTDVTADFAFMVVISIAFFLFALELIAGCIYKEGYLNLPDLSYLPGESIWKRLQRICNFGSFYFWLDMVATLSLIFEVCFQSVSSRILSRYSFYFF